MRGFRVSSTVRVVVSPCGEQMVVSKRLTTIERVACGVANLAFETVPRFQRERSPILLAPWNR
jgi:hypothetical protein